ncbi:DDE-type integrase/transposase/recombinase [Rhodococcus qingshengii]|uniref:DDE-type integrase/transposase/recombinase n=1 Tax=Rhodococcus TaxID=1827 RepID=UPI0028F1FF0E|nr:DDE-type integrase/transposase/recombinase [Rhodococcus qingshengii]MDT9664805.1 DDE-type integrase/transposase/recombinase [Rhodococcus qingshengii]
MSTAEHRQNKHLNNRCEKSRQPTRQRERAMKGFHTVGSVQRFLAVSSRISRTFDRPPPGELHRAPHRHGHPISGVESGHRTSRRRLPDDSVW